MTICHDCKEEIIGGYTTTPEWTRCIPCRNKFYVREYLKSGIITTDLYHMAMAGDDYCKSVGLGDHLAILYDIKNTGIKIENWIRHLGMENFRQREGLSDSNLVINTDVRIGLREGDSYIGIRVPTQKILEINGTWKDIFHMILGR